MLTGATRKIKELWRGRAKPSEPAVCSETVCSAESSPSICTRTPEQIAGMPDDELFREIHRVYDGTAGIELIAELESRWAKEASVKKDPRKKGEGKKLEKPAGKPKTKGKSELREFVQSIRGPSVPVKITPYESALLGTMGVVWPKNDLLHVIEKQVDPRSRIVMLLGLVAGLRPNEIVRLLVRDVDVERNELFIAPYGPVPSRTIPIPEFLTGELQEFIGHRHDGRLIEGYGRTKQFTLNALHGIYAEYAPEGMSAWNMRWHSVLFWYRETHDIDGIAAYHGITSNHRSRMRHKVEAMSSIYDRMEQKMQATNTN